MPFSYRRLFFGGTTFCCCLPVRLGVIVMSSLGCLVAGVLMVLLWFELATTLYMTTQERIAFVLAAITATVLFAASILGLVGAIVRKQLFIQTYTYILYVNFALNLAIAAYFTYEVTRATSNAENLACLDAIQDPQTQGQCSGLLNFAKAVYLVVTGFVLLTELYCVIVSTRYLNQLQREKGSARASRLDTERAFQLKSRNQHYYSQLHDPASQNMLPLDPWDSEFNPYEEIKPPTLSRSQNTHSELHDNNSNDSTGLPPPIEDGYGGGLWTHDGIAGEEKERLRRREELEDTVQHDPESHTNQEARQTNDLV